MSGSGASSCRSARLSSVETNISEQHPKFWRWFTLLIGLTAAAVGNDMERFREAGADLVMAKPLDSDALIAFLAG